MTRIGKVTTMDKKKSSAAPTLLRNYFLSEFDLSNSKYIPNHKTNKRRCEEPRVLGETRQSHHSYILLRYVLLLSQTHKFSNPSKS